MSTAVRGRLFLRGEDGYEEARVGRIFNARRPDRYPAAVLEVADERRTSWPACGSPPSAAGRSASGPAATRGRRGACATTRCCIDLGALTDDRVRRGDRDRRRPARPRRVRWSWRRTSPSAAGRFPAGTAPSVGTRRLPAPGRPGLERPGAGLGLRERRRASTWSPRPASWSARTPTRTPTCYWAARGAGPGFPGVVTRFHLQTYPAPAVMWQDTWTFALDDARGAARLAARACCPAWTGGSSRWWRRPGCRTCRCTTGSRTPGHRAAAAHHRAWPTPPTRPSRCCAEFEDGPLAGRELGHVSGPTRSPRRTARQTAQNPEGYRYAVDCAWTDAPADGAAPLLLRHLARARHRALVLDLVRLGAATARCPTWRSRSRATSTSRPT